MLKQSESCLRTEVVLLRGKVHTFLWVATRQTLMWADLLAPRMGEPSLGALCMIFYETGHQTVHLQPLSLRTKMRPLNIIYTPAERTCHFFNCLTVKPMKWAPGEGRLKILSSKHTSSNSHIYLLFSGTAFHLDRAVIKAYRWAISTVLGGPPLWRIAC